MDRISLNERLQTLVPRRPSAPDLPHDMPFITYLTALTSPNPDWMWSAVEVRELLKSLRISTDQPLGKVLYQIYEHGMCTPTDELIYKLMIAAFLENGEPNWIIPPLSSW